jgi:large subunit ribosomal protein L17
MRHQRVINHLGRTSSHRKSMISNMAVSLIIHKRITTTTAKAKALKTFVEPLITKSKEDSTHSRRIVFGYLKDKVAVAELFREISPKIADRPGGYTRILKTGNRIGDNAEMCILELVDFNEAMKGGEAAKPKTARRRRSLKKSTGEAETAKTEKKAPVKGKKSTKAEKAAEESVPESEEKG